MLGKPVEEQPKGRLGVSILWETGNCWNSWEEWLPAKASTAACWIAIAIAIYCWAIAQAAFGESKFLLSLLFGSLLFVLAVGLTLINGVVFVVFCVPVARVIIIFIMLFLAPWFCSCCCFCFRSKFLMVMWISPFLLLLLFVFVLVIGFGIPQKRYQCMFVLPGGTSGVVSCSWYLDVASCSPVPRLLGEGNVFLWNVPI